MAEIHELTRLKMALNIGLLLSVAVLVGIGAFLFSQGAVVLAVLCVLAAISTFGMLLTAPWNKNRNP